MARSVVFHNRRIIHPGAEAYVDVTGMVQPGVNTDRIAGVIGEAPYGEPGVIHVFADAESARQLFGDDSDLADGIKLLFNPSNDERVVGGATIVYAYKANRSSQAEYWVTRPPKAGALIFTVTAAAKKTSTVDAYVDFTGVYADGTFDNLIVEVYSGRGVGQQRQIATSEQVVGDTRLYLRSDLDWATLPNSSKISIRIPMDQFLAADWGTPGNRNTLEFGIGSKNKTYQLQAAYSGRQETSPATIGGDPSPTVLLKFDPSGGGSQLKFSDENNWHVAMPANASGTDAAPLSQTILKGAVGMAVGGMNNRWVLITGTTQANDAQHNSLIGKVFRCYSNDATSVTLYSPGLGLVPTNPGLKWKVMQITDAYITVTGKNGASEDLNVYMKDADNLGPPTSVLLGTVDLEKVTTIQGVVDRLNEIPGVTAVLGDGIDGNLSPDRFDFGEESEHYGEQSIGILARGDVTNPGVAAGVDIALILDATGNYEGSKAFADPATLYTYPIIIDKGTANEEILLVTDNDTGTGTLTLSMVVKNSHAAGAIIERITHGLPDRSDSYWTLATPVGSDTRIYRFGTQLIRGPLSEESTGRDDRGDFIRDNNTRLVESVASTFGRFSATRAIGPGSTTYEGEIGAAHAADMNGSYQALYNGVEGTSVVSMPSDTTDPDYPISWEHGFEELLRLDDTRVVIPLASDDKVDWTAGDIDTLVDMFQEHLKEGDESRAERQGYMGLTLPLEAGTISGVTYPRGLLEWIKYLNEERMALCGQTTRVFASGGTERVLEPWAFACQCAGIQMGTDVGEGLTLKYVKTSELAQPLNDWEPRNRLDQRKALLGGLLYGESNRGRWRIVRGQTTHIATDNLARTDINVWEVRNVLIKDIRPKLEDRFGGVGIGTPGEGVRFVAAASIASIREYVAEILEEYRADGIIVDSQDENGNTVHAWTGLSVRITGDIAYLKVQVFPKTALNFILVDFGFQIPVLTS